MRPLPIVAFIALLVLPIHWAVAQESADPTAQAQRLADRGIEYLRSQQKPDGGWQGENDPPAITAIVLKALVQDQKHDANSEIVKRGYDKLLTYQLDSGGIYKDLLANYNTAIAISSLAAADDPRFGPHIDRAVEYLKRLQWTDQTVGPQGEAVADASNAWYGGWGYGRQGRPDGSNTQMAIDALYDAGLKPDDRAFQAALVFITRMQNHSETNDQAWAGDDGGFVYTPARNGESFAGEYASADGSRRLRSYGSMTYAGLKSMIYAGLTKDDPRVKAAREWIAGNWTLTENPGMRAGNPDNSRHGLYYYYHTLARALNANDQPRIIDPRGASHDWRIELIDVLGGLQQPDGSWAGEERWMESNPVLVTSYVVLALQEALADLAEHPVTGENPVTGEHSVTEP